MKYEGSRLLCFSECNSALFFYLLRNEFAKKNFTMSFGRRWNNLNPYELHKTLINEYFLTAKSRAALLKRDTSKDKTDSDILRENHQFLWDDEDTGNLSWEKRLAKKYYDKLYKEYCIGDLTRYKENKIGLRWRTEQELIDGKGQFSCGSKKCPEKKDLRTWEVNFGYVEHGEKKNALIKLRLCPDCSYKLNYHHKKKEVKRLKNNHLKVKEGSTLQRGSSKEEDGTSEPRRTSEEMEVNQKCSESGEVSDIWKQGSAVDEPESKPREEVFDEYLEQLFL